ncbi:hypothetical protein EMVG_00258 [Emiliania huxleyi virus PS401]|jgi:hypothetical protein|nr:hypothetical protein EMVG_00258 [Emiliania huxleyi virus PS401]
MMDGIKYVFTCQWAGCGVCCADVICCKNCTKDDKPTTTAPTNQGMERGEQRVKQQKDRDQYLYRTGNY